MLILRSTQQQEPSFFFCCSYSLSPILIVPGFPPFYPLLASWELNAEPEALWMPDWGSFSLTITLAMWWNTSATLCPVLADVSKNDSPCCSASCLPLSVSIILSGLSHLLATRTLATLGVACWSIYLSQFWMLLKVCWSVQSYTKIIPIAPL